MTSNQNKTRWRKYLRTIQATLESANKDLASSTNTANQALLNQLFVVAGGFITLASALIVTKEVRGILPCELRWMLVASIGAALISLACGFAQFYIDIHFLRTRRRVNKEIMERISANTVKGPRELRLLLDKQVKTGEQSIDYCMEAQLASLVVSGLILLLTIGYLLAKAKIVST